MYTNALLLLFGILGVLLHNFIKMDELNRKTPGSFKLTSYLRVERFAIVVSLIVIISAVFLKDEIKQLEAAGKWLGIGFLAMGYMGQSVVLKVMGKANKIIG